MAAPERVRRLRENLERVRGAIAAACCRAGRNPDDVRLVAITKYVGADLIAALLELGVRELGENQVQQLVRRAGQFGSLTGDAFAPAAGAAGSTLPRWHMVGHLQRNKVKALLPHARIIHSLDSERLARRIQQVAGRAAATVEAFIEVNVAGEQTKSGVRPAELEALVETVAECDRIRLRGLMTMAPFDPDAQAARPHFARLRELLERLRARGLVGAACRHLSMGMTQDYPVAVEEGATFVRIGAALYEGVS